MITFNTKKECSKFTKELQLWLNESFTFEDYIEYVKLNKKPEYNFSSLSDKQINKLSKTPASKQPYENVMDEMFNEVCIEMFLLSTPK